VARGGVHGRGRQVDVPQVQIPEGHERDAILVAARDLQAPAGLVGRLGEELGSPHPLPGIDGTERWGERAAELIGPPRLGSGVEFTRLGQLETGEPISALVWTEVLETRGIAFHWPDAIVADVSGLEEIDIVDENDVTRPLEGAELPGHDATLEWRLYSGSGTLTSEGDAEFLERGDRPTARVRLLGSAAGLFIGRVLRWMGRAKKPSQDRSFFGRLRHFEELHSDIARRYPDLVTVADAPWVVMTERHPGPALVVVHGTYSCAIPLLRQLHPLRMQAFRFEHDTFQSISANAEQLADAINRIDVELNPVHLVGHSRGGLVARLAARRLTRDRDVVVRTYGTPHLGTPLANAGGRMFSALLSMGRVAAGGVFAWDPASWAMKLLLRVRQLPEGLEVMRTDSEALRALAQGAEPFELTSHAGAYDMQAQRDGACAYALGAILDRAFGREPHDTVVPTASSGWVGDGGRTVPCECDHFSYFSLDSLANELRHLG
jgi:pimeloyl-ACP methyl ester carboxylesterase